MNQACFAYSARAVMPAMRAANPYASLCTITIPPDQVPGANPDTTFGPSGAPLANLPYVPLAGHINIPCSAPPIGGGVTPNEVKELSEILSKNVLKVALNDYYPVLANWPGVGPNQSVISSNYRAVIDGIEYDIIGTATDSQKQSTFLAVQIVAV